MADYDLSDVAGIEKTWEEIYNTHSPVLFGYLVKKAGYDLAADIMQEAFYKLLQAMRKGIKIENTRAYLFQIARNELNMEFNRNNIMDAGGSDLLGNLADQGSNVEAGFLKKELSQMLASAKKSLSDSELEIFELRWNLGFTQVEIAAVLKKSERQIRRDLEKVARKIRDFFESSGWRYGDVVSGE